MDGLGNLWKVSKGFSWEVFPHLAHFALVFFPTMIEVTNNYQVKLKASILHWSLCLTELKIDYLEIQNGTMESVSQNLKQTQKRQ